MRSIFLSALLLILMGTLAERRAGASCKTILERAAWSSRDDTKQVFLPLEELMTNGVAHLSVPETWLDLLATHERGDDVIRKREQLNRAYEEMTWWLISSVSGRFPKFDLQHVSYSTQSFDSTPRTIPLDPSYSTSDYHWHADVNDSKLKPEDVLAFQEGRLQNFVIRVTLIAPMDLFPATVVRPIGGSLRGQALQGPPGTLTMMVLEVSEHSADFRYRTEGRGKFSWDFRVSAQGSGLSSSDYFHLSKFQR